MRAAFVSPGGGVELRDVDVPEIGDGEILVRMRACGICGTDLEKVFGKPVTPPKLGHEVVGVIEESKAPGYEVGERVFVHHHVSCHRCHYCFQGSHTKCPLFLKTNIEPGGFAEFFKVPAVNVERGAVLKVPDHVCDDEATFIEPSACVLRALERVGFRSGMSAAVVGAGSSGAMFIKLLKAFGASFIAAADVSDFRVSYARRIGADAAANPVKSDFRELCREGTEGRGVDLAVVATASLKALPTALSAVRDGGVVCLFGAPEKGARAELDFSNLFVREISLIPNYSTTEIHTTLSLRLISSGVVNYSDLITHRFNLKEIEEAFRTAADASRALKVVVYP